jgi:flagellar biosynthetic protein FliS
MDERLRHFYLESRIKNSSPGELLLMLWDNLVESAEAAEVEVGSPIGSPERTKAAHAVTRCINIITELSTALRHEVDPSLCATLSNLYCFFARQFSEALRDGDATRIGAILPLLRDLKVAWSQAQKAANQAQLASGVSLASA